MRITIGKRNVIFSTIHPKGKGSEIDNMANFSERFGYKTSKPIQFESADTTLRNRIWNLFYLSDIQRGGLGSKRFQKAIAGQPAIEDLLMDKLGFTLSVVELKLENKKLKFLQEHLLNCVWNEVYEFVEAHIAVLDEDDRAQRILEYNTLFEEEKSGYRLLNGELSPITNKEELVTIENAGETPYAAVNKHIKKATALYSDIASPDYENSVKESISAVEALCSVITGKTGAQATLGKMLKHLEEKGVFIPQAMKNAYSSLYGYTSDEGGIRHGSMEFKAVPAEDAKYMLVSCSAFVNYLVEKWCKVGN